MDYCTSNCISIHGNFSYTNMCQFVQDNCEQDTIQFIQGFFCTVNQSFFLSIIASIIVMSIIYYGIHILTDDYLEPLVEIYIKKMKISQSFAGVTFVALANGASDVITAIQAGTSDSKTTALIPFGSIFGAALFSMAYIFSEIIRIAPEKKVTIKLRQTIIPLTFYIIGTLYLFLVSLIHRKMSMALGSVLLVMYVIFIIVTVYFDKKRKRQEKSQIESSEKLQQSLIQSQNSQTFSNHSNEQERGQDKPDRKIKKRSNLQKIVLKFKKILLFILGLTIPPFREQEWGNKKAITSIILSYVVFIFTEGIENSFQIKIFGVYYAIWFAILPILMLIYTTYYICKKQVPKYLLVYGIYDFIVILSWLALLCNILINLMELFQLMTNINPVFLGLTFFAWGASITDYFSIVKFAEKGVIQTAVAGIYSGQLFNFFLGFGVGLMIQGKDGEFDFDLFDLDSSGTFDVLSKVIILVVIGMALLLMIWMFIASFAKKGIFLLAESRLIRIYYIAFILIAMSLCISSDFFRTIDCDI